MDLSDKKFGIKLIPVGDWIISIWETGGIYFRHCGGPGQPWIEPRCPKCLERPPEKVMQLARLLKL